MATPDRRTENACIARHSVLFTPVAIAWALVACEEPRSELQLTEVRRAPLSSDFRPVRIGISPSGTVTLLSASPPLAVLIAESAVTSIPLEESLEPTGIRIPAPNTKIVEIFDGRRGMLSRYGHEGLINERVVTMPVPVTHAVAAPRGWFVAGEADGAIELYWFRDNDEWHYLTGVAVDAWRRDQLHLSSAGPHALLAWSGSPYMALVVDTAGAVVHHRSWQEVPPPALDGIGRGFAYPAVLLEDFVVQSIADLEDDSHWLAIYDLAGQFIRASRLPGPLVLLASLPDTDQLVASRNLGGHAEISIYNWFWEGRGRP